MSYTEEKKRSWNFDDEISLKLFPPSFLTKKQSLLLKLNQQRPFVLSFTKTVGELSRKKKPQLFFTFLSLNSSILLTVLEANPLFNSSLCPL